MSSKFENHKADEYIRVSSKEIDEAIHKLQIAFGDGRLDEREFDERMSHAIKAKTKGDLESLLFDLPISQNGAISAIPKTPLRRLRKRMLAILSGIEQKGPFIFPEYYRITAVFGGCMLDLSNARFESDVSDLHINAIFGGVLVLVPKGLRVEIHSTPILGGISQQITEENSSKTAPLLRIHGVAILGGVEIKTVR